MEHALQVRILKELLEQIETGKNIDAGVQYKMNTDVYVCPEVAAKEREVFFQNHPQLIGLSGDLPEPNTWFTIDDFGVPVLATRDKDGNFKAFLNACRHRGARLTKDTRGKGSRFICPSTRGRIRPRASCSVFHKKIILVRLMTPVMG